MDNLLKDLGYAVRTLRKNPAFTITALITLALGIGASTAIFSVVNAVLLRPLPYVAADRLVIINSEMRNRKVPDFPFPPGDVYDVREQMTGMDGVGGVITFRQPLVEPNAEPEQVQTAFVTANLLDVLGARVALGRAFNAEDETPIPDGNNGNAVDPNAPPPPPVDVSVILSNAFWQRRYGGDAKVIGRSFDLGGNHGHVVGVLPKGFELLLPPRFQVAREPDLYEVSRLDLKNGSRINVIFRLIGRLKPGTTLAAAQAQADALGVDERKRFQINETAGVYYSVTPMRAELSGDVKPAVLSLMGAVVFVLLIACANVANLTLVRMSRRERELAVRAAFGGSRSRLIRQMLVEALVLSAGGAVLGLVIAEFAAMALTAIGPQDLPQIGGVGLDGAVLGFAMLAGLAAATFFGVIPAFRASRPNVMGVLRQAGRSSELGGGRVLRNSVVMAEVALAFVLLVGGGLMFRSFVTLANADPGFDPSGVLTFSVQNSTARTTKEREAFQRTMHDRLAAIPGVTAVTAVSGMPLNSQGSSARYGTEEAAHDPSKFRQSTLYAVIPGYFAMMRTPILAGRDFLPAENAVVSEAVIVDSLFAARTWPGENAVGKRLLVRSRADTAEWMDVVGVVRHERDESLAFDGREALFIPEGQFGFGVNQWLVRTTGDPSRLAPAVRKAVAELAPTAPIAELRPYSSYVADARSPTRFALALIGAFAVIAVVLSGVGLYGVLSTVVRQRTAEIGVRIALGAQTTGIFRLVIGQGVKLSIAGIGVGLLIALAMTRVMSSMLVGVAPTDPLTFAAVAILFFSIAVIACWIPARRAASLDPSAALRDE